MAKDINGSENFHYNNIEKKDKNFIFINDKKSKKKEKNFNKNN